MIEVHFEERSEYTYTEDLPVGTRSEIIDVVMLKRCHKLLQDPDSSEYMTWMLNRPEHFRTKFVSAPNQKIRRPEISLTVDTESDLCVMRKIYDNFDGNPPALEHIISWMDQNPELIIKNKHSPTVNTEVVNCRMVVDG